MTTEKHTPLMQQYFEIKAQHPEALLLFQVGDFYELFFDDAKMAAGFLAIALTKRGKNQGEDVPLCGIPVHALNHYLRKLIKGGFKVAICDQLSKPQPGTVVKRGVTQVFTPGTLTDSLMLDEKTASYLLSFFPTNNTWGLLFGELLTAQLFAATIPAHEEKLLESELSRFFPDEIILPATELGNQSASFFKKRGYCTSIAHPLATQDGSQEFTPWMQQQFTSNTIATLGQHQSLEGSMASLYHFLKRNNGQNTLNQLNTVNFYTPDDYVLLDASTQKNLEIIKNTSDGSSNNTLFFVIDKAKTSMGSRTLKKWLQRPLLQETQIKQRQEVVAALCSQVSLLQKTEYLLSHIADLERIIGRIALNRATIHDFLALKSSLAFIPEIKKLLSTALSTPLTTIMNNAIADFSPLFDLLDCAINDNPAHPYTIKTGFNSNLDHLRNLHENGQQEILVLEQQEIAQTGISSLKIRFNNISGYYIEVTNANRSSIPTGYQHLQTLANRQRFTTPQLKELEQALYKAEHELTAIEAGVFETVKQEVGEYLKPLRHLAHSIAYLDSLFGLAKTAYDHSYVQPTFNDSGTIAITGGRHPVIETTLTSYFVKNNTVLDHNQLMLIITGPNMGGKSTYLRQVALICLLAQIGSFVPADVANLTLIDRIFTRIGSADNLAEGKSTFLVEMEETATICKQATDKSLVILDEVGRGTSTNDGLALAQAIIEYLLNQVKVKCLFATHYHELTELESRHQNVKNYSMQCKKQGESLAFLHTILPGVADKSFGLDVARLAGLPTPIVSRAAEILVHLENKTEINGNSVFKPSTVLPAQAQPALSRRYSDVIDLLLQEKAEDLSPKMAFDLLWRCKELLKD